MPAFVYQARSASGKTIRGSVHAPSARSARDRIRELGLRPFDIEEGKTRGEHAFIWRRRAPSSTVAQLIRDLSTLLAVGTPLNSAFEAIRDQYRGRTGAMIEDLQEALATGRSFADAVDDHQDHFDPIGCAMIRVGEATGDLAKALDRYAELKESWSAIGGQIIGALMYPAIVFLVGVAVAVFLMTTVVPDVAGLLEASDRPIPWPTQVALRVSDVIRERSIVLVGLIGLMVLGSAAMVRSPKGRDALDRVLNAAPVLGELRRRREAVRLATALSAMLHAGLPLSEALTHARDALSSASVRRALDACVSDIDRGSTLGASFASRGAIPPVLAQTFAVGEESGELPDLLARFAQSQRRQIEGLSRRLTALVEPISILALASFIGLLMVATILPVLEAGDAL